MHFETLKSKRKKYFWCGLILGVGLLLLFAKTTSQAKYQTTQSIPLIRGRITNYKVPDLNVVAMYTQNESGEYVEADTVPDSGYALNNEKSYCGQSDGNGNIVKDASVTFNYHDGVMSFDNIDKKGTKCFLYFDKYLPPVKDAILANNIVDTSRKSGNFTGIFTDSTTGKIFEGPADDYGETTYFFAGANPNNWVKFAGFYWRIIRINGDGTIRLIYNGTSAAATGESTQLDSTSAFNSSYSNNMYVGYMYTSGKVHGFGTSSTIKGVLDTWYDNNIGNNTNYSNKIDTNAGFCGDRQPSTSSSSLNGTGGTGVTETYYGGYIRGYSTHQFTLKCANSSDLYTVSGASKGNKALSKPIGLITMDEVAYAGGNIDTNNSSYWLCTKNQYWTMSPSYFYDLFNAAYIFYLYPMGSLAIKGSPINTTLGVRPVINLRADTVFSSGNGTADSPYVVS